MTDTESVYKKANGKWYYRGELQEHGPYPTQEKAQKAYERYLTEARPAA